MKKLFISCPMKGRTEENIRKSMEKMHRQIISSELNMLTNTKVAVLSEALP